MGIFDLFRAKKATPPQPETKAAPPTAAEKAAPGTWDGSYRHNYFGGWQQSPIDIILRDAAGLTPNVDPRLTLSACLLMFSVLPCYTIADAGFQALMGMPEIDSEDERFKQLVEKTIWPEMRLFGEKVDRLTYTKGIEHIAKEHLKMMAPAAASIQIVSIDTPEDRLRPEALKP